MTSPSLAVMVSVPYVLVSCCRGQDFHCFSWGNLSATTCHLEEVVEQRWSGPGLPISERHGPRRAVPRTVLGAEAVPACTIAADSKPSPSCACSPRQVILYSSRHTGPTARVPAASMQQLAAPRRPAGAVTLQREPNRADHPCRKRGEVAPHSLSLLLCREH